MGKRQSRCATGVSFGGKVMRGLSRHFRALLIRCVITQAKLLIGVIATADEIVVPRRRQAPPRQHGRFPQAVFPERHIEFAIREVIRVQHIEARGTPVRAGAPRLRRRLFRRGLVIGRQQSYTLSMQQLERLLPFLLDWQTVSSKAMAALS